jgi:hypothetical protein
VHVSQAAVNTCRRSCSPRSNAVFHVDIFHVGLLVMLNFGTQLLANLAMGRIPKKSATAGASCFRMVQYVGPSASWFASPMVRVLRCDGRPAHRAFGCGVWDVLGSAIIQACHEPQEKEPHGASSFGVLLGMALVIGLSSLLFHRWAGCLAGRRLVLGVVPSL